jgi:hypothetical protein
MKMRYYLIKFTPENHMLISKFTDAFEEDYEEYLNAWFLMPIDRPNRSWNTLNAYGLRERFPEVDPQTHIQVVYE